ncbi:hypothetical protein KG090_00690 [Carnobacteriaceae bacterium zg-ZUI240]|nr:hypothetical protein [Carnobacteriaceae bacterium zg-ZUI240]
MSESKRKGYATIEQQMAANKRWGEKNRQHRTYLSKRSTSRSFINKDATAEDLEELKMLIKKRENEFC